LPPLGPARGPNTAAAIMPAAVTPPATLACPLVSALDRWVRDGVQPAALHWFGTQVTEIRQIGSYSCREMVGAGTSSMSEHAFGDALDIAGFTLVDGRKITVKDGWRGTPEEQGFLHDVQLYACQTFTTVLAPGYNAYHYDHIHVDLMHRRAGYRPCRPDAIPGEVVAARARAVYASKHRVPAYTGSVTRTSKLPVAVPGQDGYVAGDDNDVTGSIAAPRRTITGVDHDFDLDTLNAARPMPRSSSAFAGEAAIRAEELRSKVY
jgi:Extensin-like protein C-terminus